jgi:hypothetical protein
MEKYEAIRTALKSLGVTGKVRIESNGDRVRLYVDGKYFGTFDYDRKTFVD